ncbi:MAG: helix-turn-helix domain-containing protein [Lachnospiraceae bacterium]|nr:helix-turn-helix domain-containing protein [Lachnospiraceae bacterium]
MYEEQFCKRLTELRQERNVSARDMSLSLGQSESYINRVESHRMLPSMTVFFYICEYFNISPGDFFADNPLSLDVLKAAKKLVALAPEKKEHIISVINDLYNG